MTVVRIAIKKKLTGKAYHYRQSKDGSFVSEYLVRTDAPLFDDQLRAYAINLANAESRLYPSCVRFDSANVKLATLGVSAEKLRGQYSHIGLDKLWGQFVMAEEDALAFPAVAAIYERQAPWGRNGRLLLIYAPTAAEWNLYAHQQVVPLRFQKPGADNPLPIAFSQEVVEAVREANGTHVLPGITGSDDQGMRGVDGFVFTGFDVNSLRRKKRKKTQTARRTAQIHSLLQKGESESESPQNPLTKAARSTSSKVPSAGVVYMLQAGSYFKIGKSINVEKRLGQIKLQLPERAKVVHTIRAADPSQVESYWHRRFAALRRNGEWFLLGEAEIEEFKKASSM